MAVFHSKLSKAANCKKKYAPGNISPTSISDVQNVSNQIIFRRIGDKGLAEGANKYHWVKIRCTIFQGYDVDLST